MKKELNMRKIAGVLGAERRGTVHAGAGYFGALQLLSEIEGRLRVPPAGGRPADPALTERRLVGLSSVTLRRLQRIATRFGMARHIALGPMQVAALLLERAAGEVDSEIHGTQLTASGREKQRAPTKRKA